MGLKNSFFGFIVEVQMKLLIRDVRFIIITIRVSVSSSSLQYVMLSCDSLLHVATQSDDSRTGR